MVVSLFVFSRTSRSFKRNEAKPGRGVYDKNGSLESSVSEVASVFRDYYAELMSGKRCDFGDLIQKCESVRVTDLNQFINHFNFCMN